MLSFNINLTSLAVILWSGMLIIAGSIWVLSSQVRKLADVVEEQARTPARLPAASESLQIAVSGQRIPRRGATARIRSAGRAQLALPRRSAPLVSRVVVSEALRDRSAT